jgi:Family of unknown function (DUF5677)
MTDFAGYTQAQWAERQERFARAALPQFQPLAAALDALASDLIARVINPDPENGTDVMALTFAIKQQEHLRSLQTLIAAGHHRDAYLIARTMVEGFGRLFWSFQQTPDRTERWLWFGAIVDYRQTLENEREGLVGEAEDRATLWALAEQHGEPFYTKEARNRLAQAKRNGTDDPMPEDPWVDRWTPKKIKEMFSEIGQEVLYDTFYGRASEWIHWGPRAIFMAMEPGESGIPAFGAEDWLAATWSLQAGCTAFLNSLVLLNHHFALGRSEYLQQQSRAIDRIYAEAKKAAEQPD